MVKPEITTEATVGCEHATVRFPGMAATIAERRTGTARTGPVAFFECDKSTFGRTAVPTAFPHSRLIGGNEVLLERTLRFKRQPQRPRRPVPDSLVAPGTQASTSATTFGSAGSDEARGSSPPCTASATRKRQRSSGESSASCGRSPHFRVRSAESETPVGKPTMSEAQA
jgi:hypothetical protein